MSIYLGNLSISEIEVRSGVSFPAELKEFMAERHQAVASNIAQGKWHCFDVPFVLVCGDVDTATAIYKHLAPMADSFVIPLNISLQS